MSLDLRYHPCVEQRAIAETFNETLKSILPLDRLHVCHQEDDDTWLQLDETGLFSIGLGEALGGSGLGAAEEALIVFELGRRLAAPSVLATIGAAHATVPAGQAAQRTASAYRHDGRLVIVHDDRAGALLVRDGADTALYRSADSAAIDEGLWHASLHEGRQPGPAFAGFDAQGLLRLRLIDAAALAGIAQAALETGVDYAGQRRQFGRPIGGFQAVKHHCANMAIAARNARDQVTFASMAVDTGREDAALQIDCALLVAGEAALRNAATNIQIHGGIGFSEEASPHLLLKRARLLLAIAGGLEAAGDRIADASAKPSPERM